MKLTTENAHKFVGKKLTGGMFHFWPLIVKQSGDRFFVVDRNGTQMAVDDSDPIYFNEAGE